jgi:hypothetical protein
VIGLVADINFQGCMDRLRFVLESKEWRDFWLPLALQILTFRDCGWEPNLPDSEVYERCLAQNLCLITGNRNHDGPDSLEASILAGGSVALPVFTVGDAQRILGSANFARGVAIDLLDYLMDMKLDPESYRGLGRIYLPRSRTGKV